MTTPTITRKAFILEWADWLDSGRYARGRGALAEALTDPELGSVTVHYCCLGVGCEVGARHGLLERIAPGTDGQIGYQRPGANRGDRDEFGRWEENPGVLPASLANFLRISVTGHGIPEQDPSIPRVGMLTVANDADEGDAEYATWHEMAAALREFANALPDEE